MTTVDAEEMKTDQPDLPSGPGENYFKRKMFFKPSLMKPGFSIYKMIPIAIAVILAVVVIANIPCVLLQRGLFCLKVSQVTYNITSGEWSNWSNCSIRCGVGKQTRHRVKVSNGKPDQRETRSCEDRSGCKEDAQVDEDNKNYLISRYEWTHWFNWSACVQTGCNNGTRTRVRHCMSRSNPIRKVEGIFCQVGEKAEHMACFDPRICLSSWPHTWSTWSSWQACSRTCKTGIQLRKRDCISRSNSSKVVTKDRCMFKGLPGASELRDCYSELLCNVTFGWADWNDWSPCSRTCDTGETKRVRECKASSGHKVDTSRCITPSSNADLYTQNKKCTSGSPCDARWTEWSFWDCNVDNGSRLERKRSCNYRGRIISARYCPGKKALDIRMRC